MNGLNLFSLIEIGTFAFFVESIQKTEYYIFLQSRLLRPTRPARMKRLARIKNPTKDV